LRQPKAQTAPGIGIFRRIAWHVIAGCRSSAARSALWVGLTSIYGIGQERAKRSSRKKAGVDHTKKIRDLTEDEINHLRQEIEKEGRVEGDLRKEIQMNIRRLIGNSGLSRESGHRREPAGARPANAH